jgi:hypothetical protein
LEFPFSSDSIQIIAIIISAIVAIVAAFVAARYTEKYRDLNEKIVEHYRQIKINVLNPMLELTDQHYLPILEFKKANLRWDRRDTRKFAVGLNEEPTTYEVVASIVPASTSNSDLLQGDNQAQIEKELYEDCRKNHFKTLFEEWENLTLKVDDFNRESLVLANMITGSIAKTLGLPIVKEWDRSGQYVTPYCGVAIFNRMAGTGMNQLTTGQDNRHQWVSFGQIIVQIDLTSDIQKVKNIIDEEIKARREKFLQLKTNAESIDKQFVPFRANLKTMTEKQKLTGKCDYF